MDYAARDSRRARWAQTAPVSDEYSSPQVAALMGHGASNVREIEVDPKGDFESEVVEAHFIRGAKKFDNGDFAEAQSILQKGLQHAEKLPLKRRQPELIAEIKLKIATCIYNSPDLKEAEARLLTIMEEKTHENVTDEGVIRRFQASHLLAGVLSRQERYFDAESFCHKALIGRRLVLGKDHISYYELLSLLSQIYEADGQQEEAEALLGYDSR